MKKLIDHRERIYLALLFLGLVSFILSYAVNNIVVWCVFLLFFVDTKRNLVVKWDRIRNNRLILTFVSFLLVQLLGCLWSENLHAALDRVVSMLPILFLPAILLSETIPLKGKEITLQFASYSIVLSFLVLLGIHILVEERNLGTFVHFAINERLGVSQFYLAFVVFIPLLHAIKELEARKRLLLNILIGLFCIFILVSFKNITALVFLSTLWVMYTFKKFRKKAYRTSLALFFLGLLGIACVFNVPLVKEKISFVQKTTDFNLDTIKTKNRYSITKNTFEHRMLIGFLAIQEIHKTLPFGLGTGDALEILHQRFNETKFRAGMQNRYNVHNQYLEEWLKTGVLGGLLFLMLLWVLTTKIDLNQPYFPYLLVFFMLGCLFESYLNRQHGVFILAFILPMLLTVGPKK